MVVNQLRTKLDLDHARQVITISRGLRRLGRLVVDRVKYTYLGIKPSFSLSLDREVGNETWRAGHEILGFMKIGRVGSTDHENTIEKSPKGGESLKLKHRFGGRF